MGHGLLKIIIVSTRRTRRLRCMSPGKSKFIKHYISRHIHSLGRKVISFPPFLPMGISYENTFMSTFIKFISCSRMVMGIA